MKKNTILPLTPINTANFVTVLQTIQNDSLSKNNLYGSYNLGLHVQDIAHSVHHNRAALLNRIQEINPHIMQLHWLNQVHGDRVVDVDMGGLADSAISADAHITSNSHIALAIMTADCVPIMIASEAGKVIAAVHAGWQGLAKGIIRNTIIAMQDKQKKLDNIDKSDRACWQAWVGACIARQHYEVDERVRHQVLTQLETHLAEKNQQLSDKDKTRFFTPQAQKNGHYLADLPAITQFQLQVCGITSENIHLSGMDSYGEERFYSYREQTDGGRPFTGRMATIIFKQ